MGAVVRDLQLAGAALRIRHAVRSIESNARHRRTSLQCVQAARRRLVSRLGAAIGDADAGVEVEAFDRLFFMNGCSIRRWLSEASVPQVIIVRTRFGRMPIAPELYSPARPSRMITGMPIRKVL